MSAAHVESDPMGDVVVSADVYYGAQTQRAHDSSKISRRAIPVGLVHALGLVKAAAAKANADLGLLPPALSNGIAQAAEEVADGQLDRHFIVDVFQTGSGTSSNMNANEVIAKRANELLTGKRHPKEPVHPNDHVNLGQSSNDVFPTAIHVAVLVALNRGLLPALEELQQALAAKAREFAPIYKIGRTHLQDATPVSLGQEFSGYARMCERNQQGLAGVCPLLEEVPLGGTAVGTGMNTHPEFAARALAEVNARTRLALHPAANYFEALGSRHALVATSGVLKTLATDLMKIANDLRLLSSGPRCGLAEISLPALQPGSSMMPGKVNPVVPEMACQVAAQVIGNDLAVTIAGQSGVLQLNVMMPLLAVNVLESIHLLANVVSLLGRRCVAGIEANPERCSRFVQESLALSTVLVPRLGYDAAARLARLAYTSGQTVREVASRETNLSPQELDRLFAVERMVSGDPGGL